MKWDYCRKTVHNSITLLKKSFIVHKNFEKVKIMMLQFDDSRYVLNMQWRQKKKTTIAFIA